jgi:lipopolysaccharide/colanic/teichoic acid biosynthesis glycosyltransferase
MPTLNFRSYDRWKRLGDVALSSLLLVTLSPLLAVVATMLALVQGRPILFVQARPGLYTARFNLIKFRTMAPVGNNSCFDPSDLSRTTPIGRFLRAASLDELPQLWNVLKGDMSLVGPRPLLEEYLSLYTDRQTMRHHVRPGLTGLAQVSGRNQLSLEAKIELDLIYVEERSLRLDLEIIKRTLVILLFPGDSGGRYTL